MTDDEARDLRDRIIRTACRMGYFDRAEDIAQTIIEKKLRGVGLHQRDSHAIIDVLRGQYGDNRSPNGQHRLAINYPLSMFDASDTLKTMRDPRHDDLEITGDFNRLVACLRDECAQRVLILIYCLGMTHEEAGELLGYSGSRVGQILYAALEQLREILNEET